MGLTFNEICTRRGGRTPSLDQELKAALRSGRGGSGGRTFHFRVSSLTRQDGSGKVVSRSAYTVAEPGSGHSREDLEGVPLGLVGEDRAALIDALDGAVTRANGKLALNLHVELPAAFSPEQRAEVLGALVARFEDAGYPVLAAAVHADGRARDGGPQPHGHLVISARPAERQADGSWTVEPPGTRGKPARPGPIPGPAAMQALRADVAAMVNAVAERDHTVIAVHQAADGALAVVPWHGGRLRATGIDRPALPRRPVSVIRDPDRFRDRAPGRAMAAERAEVACRGGSLAQATVATTRTAWAAAQRLAAEERALARLAAQRARAEAHAAKAAALAAAIEARQLARSRTRRHTRHQATADQAAPQAPQVTPVPVERPQAPQPPQEARQAPVPVERPQEATDAPAPQEPQASGASLTEAIKAAFLKTKAPSQAAQAGLAPRQVALDSPPPDHASAARLAARLLPSVLATPDPTLEGDTPGAAVRRRLQDASNADIQKAYDIARMTSGRVGGVAAERITAVIETASVLAQERGFTLSEPQVTASVPITTKIQGYER